MSREYLNDLLSEIKIAEKTKNMYINLIMKLKKEVTGNDDGMETMNWVKDDFDTVLNHIQNSSSVKGTIKNKMVILNKFLKLENSTDFSEIILKLSELSTALAKDMEYQIGKNVMTDKQKARLISFPVIEHKLNDWKRKVKKLVKADGERLKTEKELIQGFITMWLVSGMGGKRLPPQRNDFGDLMIKNESDWDKNHKLNNFFVIPKRGPPYIVLNLYKTAYLEGQKILYVDDRVIKDIIYSHIRINDEPVWLLSQKNDSPMKGNTFGKYVQTLSEIYLNTPLGTSDYRKIYISHITGPDKKLTYNEKKEIAKRMGHSLQQQGSTYTKLDIPSSSDDEIQNIYSTS
tara:strand:- start:132 stop:1169 length:1038 start_codon:yes stop_codon:yes gene_type:complete